MSEALDEDRVYAALGEARRILDYEHRPPGERLKLDWLQEQAYKELLRDPGKDYIAALPESARVAREQFETGRRIPLDAVSAWVRYDEHNYTLEREGRPVALARVDRIGGEVRIQVEPAPRLVYQQRNAASAELGAVVPEAGEWKRMADMELAEARFQGLLARPVLREALLTLRENSYSLSR